MLKQLHLHLGFFLFLMLAASTLIEGCAQQGGTKPQVSVVDYQTLVERLQSEGAAITVVNNQGVWAVLLKNAATGRVIQINGTTVFVYEYPTQQDMNAATSHISADGSGVNGGIYDWGSSEVHFYRAKRVVVFYNGKDEAIRQLLRNAMGPQFAGYPYDPGQPTPTPGTY